jgi:hypothetical protein
VAAGAGAGGRAAAAIRRTGDPVALTVGHFMSGVTLFYQGELAAARAALETALGFYDPASTARTSSRPAWTTGCTP